MVALTSISTLTGDLAQSQTRAGTSVVALPGFSLPLLPETQFPSLHLSTPTDHQFFLFFFLTVSLFNPSIKNFLFFPPIFLVEHYIFLHYTQPQCTVYPCSWRSGCISRIKGKMIFLLQMNMISYGLL